MNMPVHPSLLTRSGSEKREAPRLAVSLPARLDLLDGTFDCELEDISISGARVSVTPSLLGYLQTGTRCILECNPLQVFCTVRWVTESSAGLQFEEPVSVGEVRMLRWHNDVRAGKAAGTSGPASSSPPAV